MSSRPRLRVQWGTDSREFDQDRVVVGRDVDCDVVVDDGRASRHHLVFVRDGDVWVVSDASSNGSFVHGQRTQQFAVPPTATVVNLGDPQGQPVTVWAVPVPAPAPPAPVPAAPAPAQRPTPARSEAQRVLPPGQLAHGHTILPADRNRDASLTIGRELGNDVVLTDPLVSRYHARLDPAPVPVLHDLGSFNGTFVNGQRVQGSVRLEPGYEVIFGNQAFRWDGSELVASATKDEFTLYADGLTTIVAGGKILIDNASRSSSSRRA